MAGRVLRAHSADEVVRVARGWIGTPYHHQASLRGIGADCLGLVRGVWREIYGAESETPPAYAPDWAEATGAETLIAAARRHLVVVARDEPGAGDVLVFRFRRGFVAKHVGIATGAATFIHAAERLSSRSSTGITRTSRWRLRLVKLRASAVSGPMGRNWTSGGSPTACMRAATSRCPTR